MNKNKKINIITGHYGSGKTNIAINLAMRLRNEGNKVAIVDLDTVNPFFTTADSLDMLHQAGIKTLVPKFSNSNLEMTVIPSEVNSLLDAQSDVYVVIDVGGDDIGATILGGFAPKITQLDYDMFYVVNQKRLQINTDKEAVELLYEIEHKARLKATAIINNTNLGKLTTSEVLEQSKEYAQKVSQATGLEVRYTTASDTLSLEDNACNNLLYIKVSSGIDV